MAGRKGRSGRKPLLEEQTIEEITNVSAGILLRWLTNPEVSTNRKIPVCKEIVLKRLPAKLEAKGFEFTLARVIKNVTNGNADIRRTEEVRPDLQRQS